MIPNKKNVFKKIKNLFSFKPTSCNYCTYLRDAYNRIPFDNNYYCHKGDFSMLGINKDDRHSDCPYDN
jgi:hypothetical protein